MPTSTSGEGGGVSFSLDAHPLHADDGDTAAATAVVTQKNETTTSTATTRTMTPGACVLCACVSARRWYVIDEDGGEEPTYVAGKGTSRERRLPLVLAPRSRWSGAGAAADPGAAALCPHCHVQNEQLWAESIGSGEAARGGGGGGGGARDVQHTMSQFDRIMSILGPRRQGGDKATPARPRRRAGKNGASGYYHPPPGGGDGTGDASSDAATPSTASMSRSAPAASSDGASSLLHRAMGGLNLGFGGARGSTTTSSREDAALREELAEVARLGHRRRRRWANDRLLRELGGPMTVADMQAQFMPPPFGAPAKPTPFEAMLDAQARGEWTGFHKVDMDKEAAFLAKIRAAEAVARGAGGGAGGDQAAAAWGRTSANARAALRSVARRSPERLEDLEATLLEFAEDFAGVAGSSPGGVGVGVGGGGPELVLPLADGFGRLLAHGLCEFHGLPSSTRVSPGGQKEFVVKPPRVRPAVRGEAAGGGVVEVDASGDGGNGDGDDDEDGDGTGTGTGTGTGIVGGGGGAGGGWRPPATTCVRFLQKLGEQRRS